MFRIEDVLSDDNQNAALEHLATKRNGSGADGMLLSELPIYWMHNKENILNSLLHGQYSPGLIKTTEIVRGDGKRRVISVMNTLDRLLTRMLAQMLKKHLEPMFLENSYAYQEGKGLMEALDKAKSFIAKGNKYVVEVDIKDYFDNIPLNRVHDLLSEMICDEAVLALLSSYLHCRLLLDDEIVSKD